MTWRAVREFTHSTWAGVTAGLVIILSVYYGPKKIMETWRWYVFECWDKRVFRELVKRAHGHYGNGFDVPDLAETVGRDEKSIANSLARLERRHYAVKTTNGWFGVKP
jgi:hypothetical protein